MSLWNFQLLRIIGKYLYPEYRFKWPQLDWWSNQEFKDYVQLFDKCGSLNDDRRWMLAQLLRLVDNVPGATAECGVYHGASSYLICQANERAKPQRQHYVFDSFEGLSRPTEHDGQTWKKNDLSVSVDTVKKNLLKFENVTYLKGWIPERFAEVEEKSFAFVHIDVDIYQPTLDSIEFFYPRMAKGGIILCDDYGFNTCPGATKAVNEYLQDKPEKMLSLCSGGGFFIKGNTTASH